MSNFQVVEYLVHEKNFASVTRGSPIGQPFATHEEAVERINRLLMEDCWKVKGYNQEADYYWARDAAPSKRRRILRVER